MFASFGCCQRSSRWEIIGTGQLSVVNRFKHRRRPSAVPSLTSARSLGPACRNALRQLSGGGQLCREATGTSRQRRKRRPAQIAANQTSTLDPSRFACHTGIQ